MSHPHHEQQDDLAIRTPLWKWLVFILIVVALPLFYSFYNQVQIEQVLVETDAPTQQ
jgi:hypothetical protein